MTSNNTMPFFMRRYGVTDIVKLNYYPTGIAATGIAAMAVYSVICDKLRTRIPVYLVLGGTYITAGAILL